MLQLTVQEWMAPPEMAVEYSIHPAYRNLRSHLCNVKQTDKEYIDRLIKFLANINARLVERTGDRTVFEFDSQEDLTQFVLTWS